MDKELEYNISLNRHVYTERIKERMLISHLAHLPYIKHKLYEWTKKKDSYACSNSLFEDKKYL